MNLNDNKEVVISVTVEIRKELKEMSQRQGRSMRGTLLYLINKEKEREARYAEMDLQRKRD